MLAFQERGIVEYSVGAVVETPYRVEGKELVFPPGRQGEPEQRQALTWLSDDKVRLGEGEELVRHGRATKGRPQLVGEWRGTRDMGDHKVQVSYLFYPQGKCLLLIPFQTQRGSYSAAAGRVRLTWPDCPMPDSAFNVDRDVLTFTPTGARQARYARY